MNIPTEMIENLVEHKHGGTGWAVVAVHEQDWMDLAWLGKGVVGTQFFRVWNKLVSPEKLMENRGTPEEPKWVTTDKPIPIHHTLLAKIIEIRRDLASGKIIIKNTRLEKVVA